MYFWNTVETFKLQEIEIFPETRVILSTVTKLLFYLTKQYFTSDLAVKKVFYCIFYTVTLKCVTLNV